MIIMFLWKNNAIFLHYFTVKVAMIWGSFHLGVGSRESIYSEYPNNLGKLTLNFVGVGNLPPTKIATLTVYNF